MRSIKMFVAGFLFGIGLISYAVTQQGDLEDDDEDPLDSPESASDQADRFLREQRNGNRN